MFKPELKDTGWETVPEIVFEITGENYQESSRLYRKFYEVERADGTKIMVSEPSVNFQYNIDEKKVSTLINDSLMDVIWDSMTIPELEAHFNSAISNWNDGDYKLRLELDDDLIFGWVHYKHEKKIKTFRFKIDLKGEFSKC